VHVAEAPALSSHVPDEYPVKPIDIAGWRAIAHRIQRTWLQPRRLRLHLGSFTHCRRLAIPALILSLHLVISFADRDDLST
jgi:hypothetical protein